MARPMPLEIPTSYSSLSLQRIALSHVPASSKTATPVILLTLNRPEKNNAFEDTMMQEIESVYRLFDLDERVKVIVFTGAGKMFCAGWDLELGFPGGNTSKTGTGNTIKEKDQEHRDSGGRAVLAIHRCRKPTIMAVNGHAAGIGATIQLPAVIRIATASAKIGFVFSRRGVVMEACSSYFLPRLIGLSRALHLTTTGLTCPASDPLLRELYSEIVPTPQKCIERALEIADDIAKNTSLLSSYLMKEMMYRDMGSAEGQHLLDSRIISAMYGGPDNVEGVKSFFEKRPGKFTSTLEENAPGCYPWWQEVNTASKAQVAGKSKM
ncbi:hypothetical protein AJ80_01982 [Polytolypa hystricis UAMH7299]|uniref:Enoyl-CoA hydratase n=1 Tax=Polytolypa hystricis (strain UAMH7299) TaxID=1447883 RepID=A0A2B7YRV8_POLH7|nr:hypothetical protein AJ80_01982 [Polytolypa hystricis UAMH7299]